MIFTTVQTRTIFLNIAASLLSTFLLLPTRIVCIPSFPIRERSVEPVSLVLGERFSKLQPLEKIRSAGKVTTEEESVVFARLDDTPAVRVVPAAGREEGRASHDLAQKLQVDGGRV